MFKKYGAGALFMAFVSFASEQSGSQAWTWLYEKRFSQQESMLHSQRAEMQFMHSDVPQFTQLIFSWNGFRTCKGHFTFWVQARALQSREWGPWHKMAEWGADIQRSYLSCSDGVTSFHHVRLEMAPGHVADAFRVRVVAQGGADLSLLRGLFVSLADFRKFQQESIDHDLLHLPSIYINNVPRQSQMILEHEDNRKMCSPTSCSMLTGFLTNRVIDPLDFAIQSHDKGLAAYGSWPFNTAHAFERCNGSVWFSIARLSSFKALHQRLQAGVPVVVSVRGELDGAPKKYESGHLLLVVGWDIRQRMVICHDPALDANEKIIMRYPLESFLRAWERSHRLAYVADPVGSE